MAAIPPIGSSDLARLDAALMRAGLRVGRAPAGQRPAAIHDVATGRPLGIGLYFWLLQSLPDTGGLVRLADADGSMPLARGGPGVLVLGYERLRDVYVLWLQEGTAAPVPSELTVEAADLEHGALTGLAVQHGDDYGPIVLHPTLLARTLRNIEAGVPWYPDALEGTRDPDVYDLDRWEDLAERLGADLPDDTSDCDWPVDLA